MKIEEIKKCKKCPLYKNQLPLLDKQTKCDVMWVGLSAKQVKDINNSFPLQNDTNSGKIIKNIEENLSNLKFYKTNLVKCPPLDNKDKLRYPTTSEMNHCIENLLKEIDIIKPKIIVLLGNIVSKYIKKYLKDNQIKLNIITIKHPSYIYVYKRKYISNYIEDTKEKIINNI